MYESNSTVIVVELLSEGGLTVCVKEIIDYTCSAVALLDVIPVFFKEPKSIFFAVALLSFVSSTFLIARVFVLQKKRWKCCRLWQEKTMCLRSSSC